MPKANRFLTIEGGEGAGKTTLIRFLTTVLQERGVEVVVTREPGGSFLGEELRELILHPKPTEPLCKEAELFLFLAARSQHIETLIKPALEADKVVICDRFNDSTIAYQAAARGFDKKKVQNLCDIASLCLSPSLTLYLDVPPSIGVRRAHRRNDQNGDQIDRIEQEDLSFHEKVREGFLELAKEDPKRIRIIDTTKAPATVKRHAEELVQEWLKQIL